MEFDPNFDIKNEIVKKNYYDDFIGEVFEMRKPRKLDPFSMLEPSPEIKKNVTVSKCHYYPLNMWNKPFWNLVCIPKYEP